MNTNEPEWIDPEVVDVFHFEQIREHGGIHGLREEGMLQSALGSPQQLWANGDPPPDICSIAAAYAFALAKNHPYLDGNKRTSAISCELFLQLNGYQFTVDEVAKYPQYLGLALGEVTEQEFAAWLRTVTQKS